MAFSFAPLPVPKPEEILHDISPFILIHKNGRVERLIGEELLPPSTDNSTGVQSKDVQISPENALSGRLYMPGTNTSQKQKLPILVYFHGGGFVVGKASSAIFQPVLYKLAFEANVIILSVDYGKAPERLYPAPYDDSWAALKWVASHASEKGVEPWLNDYVDFERVFLGGESSGANIAHQMGIRVGLELDPSNPDTVFGNGVRLRGIVLIHPYFWGETRIGNEVVADIKELNVLENLWKCMNPLSSGSDDPLINPGFDQNVEKLGCKRVLVFVAENDLLRDRGRYYCEVMEKSGWNGQVEIIEAKGEGHAFHLFKPSCENALTMFKAISLFINETQEVFE